MTTDKLFPVSLDVGQRSHLDESDYLKMYRRSIEAPEEFWAEQADRFIDWERR